MKFLYLLLTVLFVFLLISAAHVGIGVTTGHKVAGLNFTFAGVPAPVDNDAVMNSTVILVEGEIAPNSSGLVAIEDGMVPSGDDQPSRNLFFADGTKGGRIHFDLGRIMPIERIGTYSWHSGARAPQVYKLYAARETILPYSEGEVGWAARSPKDMTALRSPDLTSYGWQLIATVDTRPVKGDPAGQYGVAITSSGGVIGNFRYLLFDFEATEKDDPFGNTFYSEIDVIEAKGPTPHPITATQFEPVLIAFEAEGGKFHFTIESTDAPDLADWSEKQLKPLIQQWYPRLVAMLPSEGYQAPRDITFRFRTDAGEIPAYAGGSMVHLNAQWFRSELDREALGAVVHEMVHLVQNYGLANRTNPNATPAPGWLSEGIADYIRWFLYEPQTKGAEISKDRVSQINYDSSYRVSGNFLNWVTDKYEKDIVRQLNAAAREGRYTEQMWKDRTGKTVRELGREWKEWLGR